MQNNTPDALTLSFRILIAKKLYAPEEIPGPIAVVLEGTTIRNIWRGMDAISASRRLEIQLPGAKVEVTDLGSWSLAPGFIDLHTHGCYGYDVTTGSQGDVEAMACALPRTGVTSFFPTIATLGRAEMLQQVQRVTVAAENQSYPDGAEMLALRLEGPFICRAKKGAQYEAGIRPPDFAELEETGGSWPWPCTHR